jgi:hypothetical protein
MTAARHAVVHPDEVDYIQTVWGSVGGIRCPCSAIHRESAVEGQRIDAALLHLLYCANWNIPPFRNGKFVEVIPLKDGEGVTFPTGKGFFYYIGHPAPVTLQLTPAPVQDCNFV